jgi:hypothetical protein
MTKIASIIINIKTIIVPGVQSMVNGPGDVVAVAVAVVVVVVVVVVSIVVDPVGVQILQSSEPTMNDPQAFVSLTPLQQSFNSPKQSTGSHILQSSVPRLNTPHDVKSPIPAQHFFFVLSHVILDGTEGQILHCEVPLTYTPHAFKSPIPLQQFFFVSSHVTAPAGGVVVGVTVVAVEITPIVGCRAVGAITLHRSESLINRPHIAASADPEQQLFFASVE